MIMKVKYELLGRKAIKQTAAKQGLSEKEWRTQIAQIIDAAWANPTTEQLLLQKQLFPHGKPSPEEFIIVMALEVKKEEKVPE